MSDYYNTLHAIYSLGSVHTMFDYGKEHMSGKNWDSLSGSRWEQMSGENWDSLSGSRWEHYLILALIM